MRENLGNLGSGEVSDMEQKQDPREKLIRWTSLKLKNCSWEEATVKGMGVKPHAERTYSQNTYLAKDRYQKYRKNS